MSVCVCVFQTEIPHAYMQCEARIDGLLGVRKQLKADGVQASLNDYIVKAAALCLRLHPQVNCVWNGDQVSIVKKSRLSPQK